MTLIQIVVILIVLGIILWLVNSFIPMDARIKQIINYVVIIAIVLWLVFSVLLPLAGLGSHTRIG